MTRPRQTHNKALVAGIAAIFLLAALLGIAWNQQLLRQAWTGQAPTGTTAGAQPQADIPLPLGLMQVKELFDRKAVRFVDARDAESYASGHIIGAHSLPLRDFDTHLPRFIAEVPPAVKLVVYCNGYDCHDSRELGVKLLRAGYRSVYVFDGGYPEWRDAGYPAEEGKR